MDEDLMKKCIVSEMGNRQKKERLMKTSFAFSRLCVALFVCCRDVVD
jgi:hypothetical protein